MKALVDAEYVLAHLDEFQVLEVGSKTAESFQAQEAYAQYLNGHIPNAQYVDLNLHFCALGTDLHYQHPNQFQFAKSLVHFQLQPAQNIVIYDRENHIWATRLWWVLHAYGFENIYVLSGGFNTWIAKGLTVEQGEVSTKFVPNVDLPQLNLDERYFASQQDIENVVSGQLQAQLINVLRPEVFDGSELRYARRGHIPRSINIPFAHFLNEQGEFYSSFEHIASRFGLDLNKNIIIYCGSGITASGAAFALIQSQAHSVKIYDGSMAEWSSNPNLPLQSTI
ncbi:sulfurtransferase [Acinetobacter shaoyimingii]|uniref:Sulfurtransferase n=1 Tax=Acinetobacter shaoyimingii TaxID=2715164 RepID=A0A6G8RVU2_9GAMM|nr:rhodanese-like domain-containing protein [Acinetobacter shaoyimingii]QIO06056.1 sulfurtransferase [Acinetobacter shaoyimingii]